MPRIENADEVMFVGSGRPLEDAARVAFKAMVGWVRARRAACRELDAYQFVSQNARAPIIQLVDPEYTVLVKMDKAPNPARVEAHVAASQLERKERKERKERRGTQSCTRVARLCVLCGLCVKALTPQPADCRYS